MLMLDRYFPSPMSSAKLMCDLAAEMTALGHDVAIITGDDSLDQPVDIADEQGVTVVRARTGTIPHASAIMRVVNEQRLPGNIWRAARPYFEATPCDVLVYYSPTIFWTGLVRKLKALHGCGTYLVLRDLFPQWALDAGLLSRYGPAYQYFRFHEKRLYRTADVIGVQSPATLNYFSDADRHCYKLEVLYNWAEPAVAQARDDGFRRRHGLENKVVFVYGGKLGVAQDIDNILRLAHNLRDRPDVFFLLLGEGSEFQRIRDTIEQRGLKNVALHPAVPQAEYLAIIDACDVGLITLRRDLRTPNFPGKMLSYMQLKKPMLASINTGNDLSAMLREHHAGLVCANGDDEEFRRQALALADDADLRRRLGINGHRLLQERFNVVTAARQILGHFPPGRHAVQ